MPIHSKKSPLGKLLAERNVSPRFRAFAEFIAGAPRTTNPSITSLCVTSDGFLIGQTAGSNSRDRESGSMLGTAANLRDNLRTICGSYYPEIANALRAKLGGCDYWRQW